MIEYFIMDKASNSLIRVPTEQPGCWIALFEPTPEELEEISQRFHIDEDDIAAPLDLEEISRSNATKTTLCSLLTRHFMTSHQEKSVTKQFLLEFSKQKSM